MTSIKPAYNQVMILTFLLLVLGGFTMNAWGAKDYYTCTVAEDALGYSRKGGWSKNDTIFSISFDNADGVDSLEFNYYCDQGVNVFYSTSKNGSSPVKLDDKGKTSSGNQRFVGNFLTGAAKNAKYFGFTVKGGTSNTALVNQVKVFKSPTVKMRHSSFEFASTPKNGSTRSVVDTINTFNMPTGVVITTDSVAISGTDASYFTVYSVSSPSGSCPTIRTLTITYAPTEVTVGEAKHTATATIRAGGKTTTITLYGTATDVADPEYSWNGDNTYYVDDEDLDLSTLWTSTSDGDIVYDFTFTPADGEHSGSTAPALALDGHTLSIGKAGQLDLTLTQDEGAGYAEGSDTKTITIARRNPVFAWNTQANYYYNTTVSNFLTKTSGASYTVTSDKEQVAAVVGTDLKIYNKETATAVKIKYVHPETYKWNAKKDSVSFTPGWKADQLPITSMTSSNYNTYKVSMSQYVDWFENVEDGHTQKGYRMGSGGADNRNNNAIIHFTGIPDSIYFDVHIEKYATFLPDDATRECKIYESPNNSTYTLVGDYSEKVEWKEGLKEKLKSDTRYIKFVYNGTIKCHFNNIRITKREDFKTREVGDSTRVVSALNFGTNIQNVACDAKTFKFHHAGAGYITSVSSNNAHFTVSPTSVVTGGEVCDSAVITVTYLTSDIGTHNGTITISDNLGNSTTVSVTGTTVEKFTPTITWPGTTSFLVGSTIANGFVAKDENNNTISGTWSFESSDPTVIDIVDGELIAKCGSNGGKATITGTLAAGATWVTGDLEQELTVTRNEDTYTWSNVGDDGKIHVWANSNIPSTIASVNADTTVTYTSSDATYVSVTSGTTLRALAHGEVTLTASSLGDCTYDRKSESKTIVVDACPQRIVWEQSFNNFELDEKGEIDEEVTLNAYAVDSTNAKTNLAITYSLEKAVSFASIAGSTLSVTGLGRVKIIATVSGSTKFAGASLSKTLHVREYGAVCEADTLYYQGDDSGNVSGNDGGPYYKFSLNGLWTETKSKEITWEEGGCPAYVTFWRKSEDSDTGDMLIEQYLPRISDWSLVKNEGLAPSGTWTYDSLHLDSTATKLRVKIQSGKKSHYFRSLTVVRSRFIEVREDGSAKSTLVFDDVKVNSSDAKTISVVHSNINSQIVLTLSDGAPFTLSDDDIEGSCDGSGSSDITLTYNPLVAETHGTYTLTLTDGTVTKVITLDATAAPEEKEVSLNIKWSEIDWDSEPDNGTAVVVKENKTLTIDEEVTVYSLEIESGAKVIVDPVGGLNVYAGGIIGTGKNNVTLKAGTAGATKGQTGYLRVSPDYTGDMPTITTELYSIAYADNSTQTATWQYVGVPLGANIGGWDVCTYGEQFIYGWSETSGDWFDAYSSDIEPFKGYCLTQNNNDGGRTFTFTGQIAASRSKEISLSYAGPEGDNKGYHVLANSFTAPIDITRMDEDDFVNADATIYLFNTGAYDEDGYDVSEGVDSSTPGQYIAVPVESLSDILDKDPTFPCVVIPAMQGFCVQATAASASLTLDYSKLVWNANYGTHPNKPMRVVAKKAGEPNVTDFIKMTLSDGEAADILYLLASGSYDKSYENGYDAPKMMSDDPSLPNIFAVEDDGQLAIDATSDIESTFIGVRAGAASNYTLYFSHVDCETEWMLLDIQTNKTTRIADGASYSFSATPDQLITNRFLIVEWDGKEGTATGTEEITIQNKIQKFIYNDQFLILKDGVLYDARGRVVRR